jgi:diacylglycerol kinase family enzyme
MEPMIILFNPSSDQGRAAGKRGVLQAALDRAGVSAKIIVTQSEGHLRRLARDAGRFYSRIVGAGGDSTYSIIAGEILSAGTGAALGMLPLGSSNDISREFGMERLEKAVAVLKAGRKREVDLGLVKSQGRALGYFLGQANVGLGAFVNRRVARRVERRKRFTRSQSLAGFWAVRDAIRSGEVPLRLEIAGAGTTTAGSFMAAVFSNIRYWATGKAIAPEARTDDGLLDLCLVKSSSLLGLAGIYRLAGKGRHGRSPLIQFLRSPSFRLHSEIPFEIQADGEILGTNDGRTKFGELEIEVVPRALKLIG